MYVGNGNWETAGREAFMKNTADLRKDIRFMLDGIYAILPFCRKASIIIIVIIIVDRFRNQLSGQLQLMGVLPKQLPRHVQFMYITQKINCSSNSN